MIRRMAYVLLLVLSTSTCSLQAYSVKAKILSFLGHWAVAAGPSWLESYNCGILLSTEYALAVFGNDDVSPEIENSIRYFLKQVNYADWDTLPLKMIKADMQPFIYSPLACTDSVLFVNPNFYDELDEGEKKAVVAHAVTMIEQQHLLTSTCVMATLPLVTEVLLRAYRHCMGHAYTRLPDPLKSTTIVQNSGAVHNYITSSSVLKLVLNHIAGDSYHKYAAKQYDLNSANRANTAKDLLNYYIKRSQKIPYKSWLSKRNEPTLHQRMKYLMPLIKRDFPAEE